MRDMRDVPNESSGVSSLAQLRLFGWTLLKRGHDSRDFLPYPEVCNVCIHCLATEALLSLCSLPLLSPSLPFSVAVPSGSLGARDCGPYIFCLASHSVQLKRNPASIQERAAV